MDNRTVLILATLVSVLSVDHAANAEERKVRGLTFTTPKGWVVEMKPSVISVVALTVGESRVTATPLPRTGAKYDDYRAMNVNRWRQQLRLPTVMKGEIAKDVKTIKVDRQDSDYFDLIGAEKRILGAIIVRGDRAWFFKMIGPPDDVGKHKAEFEAFVKSLKIAMALDG